MATGWLLVVLGVLLAGLGGIRIVNTGNRTVKARDISGSVMMGNVIVNDRPTAPEKPAHGWVEWSGYVMTVLGLVVGVVGLWFTLVPPGH